MIDDITTQCEDVTRESRYRDSHSEWRYQAWLATSQEAGLITEMLRRPLDTLWCFYEQRSILSNYGCCEIKLSGFKYQCLVVLVHFHNWSQSATNLCTVFQNEPPSNSHSCFFLTRSRYFKSLDYLRCCCHQIPFHVITCNLVFVFHATKFYWLMNCRLEHSTHRTTARNLGWNVYR